MAFDMANKDHVMTHDLSFLCAVTQSRKLNVVLMTEIIHKRLARRMTTPTIPLSQTNPLLFMASAIPKE